MIKVEITCPAKISSINYIENVLEETFKETEFKEIKTIMFAIHELIINAIEDLKNSNHQRANEITIKIKSSKDEVEALFINFSENYCEKNLTNRFQSKNLHDIIAEENGRGLLLVQHLVDEMWYTYDEDQRFILGIKKGVKQ